jgi:prepilin-type processing-associated H-X9-DG protein
VAVKTEDRRQKTEGRTLNSEFSILNSLLPAFSLTELLVVVSAISLVMAVSMPALVKARSQARAVVCRSNVRQLVLANIGYAGDNEGFYVPGSEDLWNPVGPGQGGYRRWHGKRIGANEPFDPLKGPLAGYLGDGKIKECPTRADFTKEQTGDINFELGCGGYGYNMAYLGCRLWSKGITTFAAMKEAYGRTTNMTEVRRPGATLMFSDTAFYQSYAGCRYLIEYSFAEPPFYVSNGMVNEGVFNQPSIHFRHQGRTNVGWVDGHIEPRRMADMEGKAGYDAASAGVNIGWFEPVDNTPFDLQ